MEIRSYVALGDSFTEGLDDPTAVGGGYRGWADRFAEHLAAPSRACATPTWPSAARS